MYEINAEDLVMVGKRFTYHKPQEGQPERYAEMRDMAKDLAVVVLKNTPKSREQSVALTKLEEFVMWANAAIARNESGPEPSSGEPPMPGADKVRP